MPFQVIESTDPIASLIRFQTSPVYEMILSLQALRKPGIRTEWVGMARATLSADFLAALEGLYGPYLNGSVFFELGVDYPNQHDVPGFIRYVRDMDPVSFLFYFVGRIISRDQIARTGFDFKTLEAVLTTSPFGEHCWCTQTPFEAVLDDVPAFQHRLAEMWQWYWEDFFHTQVDALRSHWDRALDDKTALLDRLGGMGLFEHVTGKTELLPVLPADHPITEIVFIPSFLMPTPVFMFYGYGNITVIFDSERTEARLTEIQQHKDQALATLKALGDNSRLDILRLVSLYGEKMSGKLIAQKLKLSASAVSRHLAQLKEAGLIEEEVAADNRTITYRLQREAITSLPEQLMDYLFH